MAQSLTTNTAFALGKVSFSAPFVAVFDWLVMLGANSSRAKAIDALGQISDAELEAKGTTRRDETIRILGAAVYL